MREDEKKLCIKIRKALYAVAEKSIEIMDMSAPDLPDKYLMLKTLANTVYQVNNDFLCLPLLSVLCNNVAFCIEEAIKEYDDGCNGCLLARKLYNEVFAPAKQIELFIQIAIPKYSNK